MSQRKKVLVVSYFFPPIGGGGVARTVKFVKYLREFGYDPIVLAPGNPRHTAYDDSFMKDIPSDVLIVRTGRKNLPLSPQKKIVVKDVSSSGFDLFRRKIWALFSEGYKKLTAFFFVPDPQAVWQFSAVRAAKKILQKHDVALLYSTSSPYTNHLIARTLHRRTGLPWVADFRDHWTLSALYSPITSIHRWIHRRQERSIYEEANAVVLNQEQNRKDALQHFDGVIKKHAVIPNGFDPSDFPARPPKKHDVVTMRYFGSLYAQYAATPLLRILEVVLSQTNRNLHIEFIGDVDRKNREIIQDSPYYEKNIFLRAYAPHAEVNKIMQETTVTLLTLPDFKEAAKECMIPQKLYEYLGAGRPIIACVHPEGMSAKIVQTLKVGCVVSQDETSVQENAKKVLASLDEWEKTGWNISIEPEKLRPYHRRELTASLAHLFDEVVHEA